MADNNDNIDGLDSDDLRYDVLCYGTISFESVTRLVRLPTPRRDATATQERDALGGEALNVALPLAAWGLRVAVVGNFIGADRKAEFILEELAKYPRIDTRYIIQHRNLTTPFSRVFVTPDGERSRIAYWYDQTPKDELLINLMAQARILSIDAYGRDERDRAAQVAHSLGKPVISADAIWPQHPLAGLSTVVIISSAWLQANFPGVYEYDHALELQARGRRRGDYHGRAEGGAGRSGRRLARSAWSRTRCAGWSTPAAQGICSRRVSSTAGCRKTGRWNRR